MTFKEKAEKILELVGGKENVGSATFCMTRLRLTMKDRGLIDDDSINNIEDIIGTKYVGRQYQIIIGPDVENVYKEFVKLTNLDSLVSEENSLESVNKTPQKLTLKGFFDNLMDVIGACVTPILPIITCAGLLKMIVALLGPTMLNVWSDSSNIMQLFTFVADAGFYFLPFYVAYSSAKKFQCNIPMTLFIAGIMFHPTIMKMVEEGTSFSVYGIPMILTSYASSFIPMILIAWVQSYVEKFLNRIVPKMVRALLYPLALILIMLPIALCVLGPLGTILGNGIASFIVFLHQILGPVATGLVAAVWPLIIVTGMHQALNVIAIDYMAKFGMDSSILVGAVVSAYVMMAIGLAYIIKAKNAEQKEYGISSFITLTLGGISEPTIFGILLRNKKSLIYLIIGGFCGGFYAGLMNVAVYFFGQGNFLVGLMFSGANPNSLPQGLIASAIGAVIAFVLAMIFGFDDSERISLKKGKKNEKSIISK